MAPAPDMPVNLRVPAVAGAEAAPPRPRRRRHRSWLQGTAAPPRVDDEEAFERAVDAQVEEDRVLDIGGCGVLQGASAGAGTGATTMYKYGACRHPAMTAGGIMGHSCVRATGLGSALLCSCLRAPECQLMHDLLHRLHATAHLWF
jgi:hypothetical protein